MRTHSERMRPALLLAFIISLQVPMSNFSKHISSTLTRGCSVEIRIAQSQHILIHDTTVQNEIRGKKIGQDIGISSSPDSYKAPYFQKARSGCSGNFRGTFNPERNLAATTANRDTKIQTSHQGMRARRRCFPCQQSYRSCGEFEFIDNSRFICLS